MRKSSKMIMFAVVAVIIVAVPTTLYEGNFFNNLPPITVNSRSANASYTWTCNFNNSSDISHIAPVLYTTSIISDNGHPNSSLSFSLWTTSTYQSSFGPSVCYVFILLISGNFTSNLHPSSISVTNNGTVPPQAINLSKWFNRSNSPQPEYSKDWAKVTLKGTSLFNFEQNDTYGNVTFKGSSPSSYLQCDPIFNLTNVYSLTNDTGLGKNITYHFSFLTKIDYAIFNTILISPFYLYQPYTVHFMVTLKGLSKPVTEQIAMTLEDVPA